MFNSDPLVTGGAGIFRSVSNIEHLNVLGKIKDSLHKKKKSWAKYFNRVHNAKKSDNHKNSLQSDFYFIYFAQVQA